MKTRTAIVGILIVAMGTLPACRVRNMDCVIDEDLAHFVQTATDIEYPEISDYDEQERLITPSPLRIRDYEQAEFWELSLEQAIQLALANSQVLRDLGGTVLRAPGTTRTAFEPALQETDPRFGLEAALSAFDATLETSIFAEQNDRRLNNQFLGNLGILQQNFGVLNAELKKRAATGSQFILRKNVEFDKNSSLGNEFDDGWTVIVEGEMRQPLLQGAGLPFNRIAGPDGGPGAINGVLIARVKTDLSLAEFELGVRDLISNVENAYWDLYYAYRDLDAKIVARNSALDTWRRINALRQTGRRGGEAEKEAQAREQYFQFKLEVENALTGRLLEGTRTNNGSHGGTFRGSPGIYVNERRLRLIMGIPINGDKLIRPADEPPSTQIFYDWDYASAEAFFRRAELRRQKWEVKRREMELLANRNLLLPNFDFVGRYTFRGFGDNLINSYRNGSKPQGRFENAYMNLTSGDFQEWQMGFEFSMPFGFRQAHTAVRNAELQLARSHAVLKEQEHQILHDLSDAISEVDRAYVTMETTYNRLRAAKDQLDAVTAAFEADKVEFFVVLDSQRRLADTASQYYQAKVEYALALRNVHFEKGTLLDYCGVSLSEGSWPNKALCDAVDRNRRRSCPLNYRATRRNPPMVSQGSYPQDTLEERGGSAEALTDPFDDEQLEPLTMGPTETPPPRCDTSSPPRDPIHAPYVELVGKLERLISGTRKKPPCDVNTDDVGVEASAGRGNGGDAERVLIAQPPTPDAQQPEPPNRQTVAGADTARTKSAEPQAASSTASALPRRGVPDESLWRPAGTQPRDPWSPLPESQRRLSANDVSRPPLADVPLGLPPTRDVPDHRVTDDMLRSASAEKQPASPAPLLDIRNLWSTTDEQRSATRVQPSREWTAPPEKRDRQMTADATQPRPADRRSAAWKALRRPDGRQAAVGANQPSKITEPPNVSLFSLRQTGRRVPDAPKPPRIAGKTEQKPAATVSLKLGQENRTKRVVPAMKWSPTGDDGRDVQNAFEVTPQIQPGPSVRLLAEPRTHAPVSRESSDSQVRFLPQGPVRRLPPVATSNE